MTWYGTPDRCPKDDTCYEYYDDKCKGTKVEGMVCKEKRELMKWYRMEEAQEIFPYVEFGWNENKLMILRRT